MMKLFCLLCLIPCISFAQTGIHFQDLTLQEALAKSKKVHQPVFFMAFASWCPHCQKMMDEVFVDPGVADFYNASFICLKQDMEQPEGIALQKIINVKSYPTFVFFDADGTTLYRMNGESDIAEFLEHGKNALTPEKQLPYLEKQFDADKGDPDKCYAYVLALKRGSMDLNQVMQQYLSTKNEAQLLNELNWKILANGITDISSAYFRFILDHQSQYASITSPYRVQRKIYYTVKQQLEPLVASNDTLAYFRLRPTAAAIHTQSIDSLLFTFDLDVYAYTKNWNAYQTTASQNIKKYAWTSDHVLRVIADTYLKNITDVSALAEAATWAQRSLELNETYTGYILAAKLFQASGNEQTAIQLAIQGKNMAEKYGWDASEAVSLLKKLGQ